MSMQVSAILVGRWKIGLADRPPDARPTILMLDFDKREPINLAFPPDQAVQIARHPGPVREPAGRGQIVKSG